MKILITSGIFPPDIGGPASYVPKIATELSKRGHKVTVLCLSEQDFDDSKFNFHVIRINRKIFLPVRILLTIIKIISLSVKSDLIFANTLTFESSIGAIFSKRPIVHKIVGDYAWERARNKGYFKGTIDEYQKKQKGIKLLLLDTYFKYFLRFSKTIITPSNYLKDIVIGWNKNLNVVTIYNAIDFPKDLEMSSDKISFSKILTVSRLVSWKNIDQIILSLVELKDFSLDIAGEGPEKENLVSIVKKNRLEKRVRFHGQLNQRDVYKLMLESDLFILNSSYEGLPHVIVEAMYANLPVICSNVGGCPEIVKNNRTGLLFDKKKSIDFLVDKLKAKDFRDLLVKNAHQHVREQFDINKMYDLTIIQLTQ